MALEHAPEAPDVLPSASSFLPKSALVELAASAAKVGRLSDRVLIALYARPPSDASALAEFAKAALANTKGMRLSTRMGLAGLLAKRERVSALQAEWAAEGARASVIDTALWVQLAKHLHEGGREALWQLVETETRDPVLLAAIAPWLGTSRGAAMANSLESAAREDCHAGLVGLCRGLAPHLSREQLSALTTIVREVEAETEATRTLCYGAIVPALVQSGDREVALELAAETKGSHHRALLLLQTVARVGHGAERELIQSQVEAALGRASSAEAWLLVAEWVLFADTVPKRLLALIATGLRANPAPGSALTSRLQQSLLHHAADLATPDLSWLLQSHLANMSRRDRHQLLSADGLTDVGDLGPALHCLGGADLIESTVTSIISMLETWR